MMVLLAIISVLVLLNFGVAVIAARMLWPRRSNTLARIMGELLIAIVIQGICWAAAASYLPQPRPIGYRNWMLGGYSATSIVVWRLGLWLAGLHNGKDHE